MSLLGIDVSHHQGAIDWFAVARGNVKFAFAKATEGNAYSDPTFARHWQRIQEAGLFRGAYHFARPGRDAETQAEYFASIVGTLGFRDLSPVLDLEESDGHPAEYVLQWAKSFITKAEALFQRRLIIYTGEFWRGPLKNSADPFFGERALWLADYRAQPKVPAAWKKWALWQYSEGQHNAPVVIPGVRPCDQDRFEGTEAELEQLCASGEVAAESPKPSAAAGVEWPGVTFIWPKTPAVSGDAVKTWQKKMIALGFSIDADGVYGPQSKSVCVAFQRNSGLSVDGIVGRRTWAAAFGV